jgi:hypothetical protein
MRAMSRTRRHRCRKPAMRPGGAGRAVRCAGGILGIGGRATLGPLVDTRGSVSNFSAGNGGRGIVRLGVRGKRDFTKFSDLDRRRECGFGYLVGIRTLACNRDSLHTADMTPKNAAFLALISMLLLTLLQAADFIHTVLGVARDLIPAMALLRSLVYLLACLGVTTFFFVVFREQSR